MKCVITINIKDPDAVPSTLTARCELILASAFEELIDEGQIGIQAKWEDVPDYWEVKK